MTQADLKKREHPTSEPEDSFKPLKVTLKKYKMLDGLTQERIERVSSGSIIKRFEATPYPKKDNDVICPHFMELKWGYGCPYDCAWCFLKGTLRMLPEKTAPKAKERSKIQRHTLSALQHQRYPEMFNTGELCDSLMDERGENPFSKWIVKHFQTQRKHKVLFLTKSSYIDRILEIEDHSMAVVSFSLNSSAVSKKWEKAPSPESRIKAAAKLADEGWEVRIRIDPVVPIPHWRKSYSSLIENIFNQFQPTRVTIGTLRGLQSTLNNITDNSWIQYLDGVRSSWGKKTSDEKREMLYRYLFDKLEHHIDLKSVGLCKETVEMFNKLDLNFRKQTCNCIL